MAGQIDNTTILEAINQLIKAVNDLTAKTAECCARSGGGGGCGGGGAGPIIDDEPATGQPGEPGSGPGGYPDPSDWDDQGGANPYDTYKCKASNFVYDAIYTAMVRLGGA